MKNHHFLFLFLGILYSFASISGNVFGTENITEDIWLTISDEKAETVVISWVSPVAGISKVFFGKDAECRESSVEVKSEEVGKTEETKTFLNFVPIPVMEKVGADSRCFYRTETKMADGRVYRSAVKSFVTLATDELRLAFIGNVHTRTIPETVAAQKPHIVCLTGDMVPKLWENGMSAEVARENVKPFCQLVAKNRELFSSTLLMVVLGNHDREIVKRGERVPGPSVSYDTEGSAFCRFFALPGDRWKWYIDWEPLSFRLVGLDLNHIYDHGTSLQSSHAWQVDSEQFQWFERVMNCEKKFIVTFQNEKCSTVRSSEKAAWEKVLAYGDALIAGFGHYAERAEKDGMKYFNTSYYGCGDKYPDRFKTYFESRDNFLLLTVQPKKMVYELRDIHDATVLDRSESR